MPVPAPTFHQSFQAFAVRGFDNCYTGEPRDREPVDSAACSVFRSAILGHIRPVFASDLPTLAAYQPVESFVTVSSAVESSVLRAVKLMRRTTSPFRFWITTGSTGAVTLGVVNVME